MNVREIEKEKFNILFVNLAQYYFRADGRIIIIIIILILIIL